MNRMDVLFAISLLALAGLLWASLAAARHIRKARKRDRLARSTTTLASRTEPPNVGYAQMELSGPVQMDTVIPPPLQVVNWANWDECDDLDPLSEVTRSFSPAECTDVAPWQLAQASGRRAHGLQPPNPVLNGTRLANGVSYESASAQDQPEYPFSSADRSTRAHSLHVHG